MIPVHGGSVEIEIYTYLTGTMNFNNAAAAGVLANIYKESSFNHQSIGDNGTSYGLCQWHDTSKGVGRWTNLKKYCSSNKLNPTTVRGQLEYLNYELRTSYSTLLGILRGVPNTAQGCWDAAAQWCARFEIPQGYGSWNNGQLTLGPTSRARGDLARNTYWTEYSSVSVKNTPATNKGNLIVAEARKHMNKPYVWGATGPNSFDCSGFVYYVYKTAIDYDWSRTTARLQWNYGRQVSDLKAGDLVFFTDTYQTGSKPNISHIGIATGNGTEFIHASSTPGVSVSDLSNSYWRSHYYGARRLVSDSETSSGNGSIVSGEVSESMTFRPLGEYQRELDETLEYIDTQNVENYKTTSSNYGYIVDLDNGGEFRFIVPEYEESITSSYDNISIIGRSVSILGYNNTSSRAININLELYAGVGLYEKPRGTSGDRVKDLHDDIAFLQSLNYPDYSKSIVLPPPRILLYLGPTLSIKGVVTDVRVSYKKPYDISLRPMRADVSFTVLHSTDTPPDCYDVRNHEFEGKYSELNVFRDITG